ASEKSEAFFVKILCRVFESRNIAPLNSHGSLREISGFFYVIILVGYFEVSCRIAHKPTIASDIWLEP
ncbi:MAG: hypothetical protein KA188_10005, partial [Leadbetterella sp.]|nr:hypothetical protein [Leadbetterella sp.]